MICSIFLLIFLFPPGYISGISIDIDGIIDLGPKWNYIYNIKTNRDSTKRKHITAMDSSIRLRNDRPDPQFDNSVDKVALVHNFTKDLTTDLVQLKSGTTMIPERVTKYDEHLKFNGIFEKPHKVRDDVAVNEFMKHVFKQTLIVFETLKHKINDENVKNRIDFLSRSYETKFHDFVTETQTQTIKTKLGEQKVIFNTIDTSNRILKRLVNYLIGDMANGGGSTLGTGMAATNVIKNEVDKEIAVEFKHACVKFGVCRDVNNFGDFLVNFINIILTNDDRKIKLATDALTEVMKNVDFDRIMDNKTGVGFLKGVDYIEKSETSTQRAMFVILKNVLRNRNKPFVVETTDAERSVNKTVAFLNFIDILEKALPGDDVNQLAWNDIKNSMREWSDGSRDDIVDIMEAFVDYLKRAVDKLDTSAARNVGFCLYTIFVNDG